MGAGYLLILIILAVTIGYFFIKPKRERNQPEYMGRDNQPRTDIQTQTRQTRTDVGQERPVVPITERSETGPMVYFANNSQGITDNEYHFNYKRVNGAYRAYILRMPSLGNRDASSVITHRLHEGESTYVCWEGAVTSLKDMQNISRVWADSIQKYIATGKRFGPS